MKKGFFSAALNALIIAAAVTAALFALTYAASYDASLRNLEAKKVADRAYDANYSHPRVVQDALLDAAYQYYGCSALAAGTFCSNANSTYASYLSNYTAYLNDSTINTNAAILEGYCNSTDTTAGFDWSYAYAVNTSLASNSSNAERTIVGRLSGVVDIRNYTPLIVNDTQVCSDAVLMRIAINDSARYVVDYYIDCNQTVNYTSNPCP